MEQGYYQKVHYLVIIACLYVCEDAQCACTMSIYMNSAWMYIVRKRLLYISNLVIISFTDYKTLLTMTTSHACLWLNEYNPNIIKLKSKNITAVTILSIISTH